MLNHRPLDACIFLASFLFVGYYVWGARGGFPLDDSWIHQGYARNLSERGKWVLIPGEQSNASTSPAQVFLLAKDYTLGVAFPFGRMGLAPCLWHCCRCSYREWWLGIVVSDAHFIGWRRP